MHTLEAHLPDLSDLPASKLARGNLPAGSRIGDVAAAAMGRILVRGEPGNGLVPELTPAPGELVVHKPGKGAFYATGLEGALRSRRVTHLLMCGVTTEVCVATTMREANDRGAWRAARCLAPMPRAERARAPGAQALSACWCRTRQPPTSRSTRRRRWRC